MTMHDEASREQLRVELEGVLGDATSCLAISHMFGLGPNVSIAEYAASITSARNSSDEMERRSLRGWQLTLTDDSVADRLGQLVDQALEPFVEGGRVQLPDMGHGDRPDGHPTSTLVQRLLQLLALHGANVTARRFVDSLDDAACAYQDLTLLRGVIVKEEIEVFDGVRLVPSHRHDGRPSPLAPVDLLDENSRRRFQLNAILVQDCKAHPRYMRPSEWAAKADRVGDGEPFSRSRPQADSKPFDRDAFCHALTLATDSPVVWCAVWEQLESDEIVNVSDFACSTYWYQDVRHAPSRLVPQQEHIDEAKRIYSAFMSHDEGTLRKLDIAFERLDQASNSQNALIDLAIALEVMYLSDRGGGLKQRLKTRVARHLGADLEERKQIANLMAAFYGARSQLVHSGDLKPSYKVQGRGMVSIFDLRNEVAALCMRALRSIVTDGMPDLEALDLG